MLPFLFNNTEEGHRNQKTFFKIGFKARFLNSISKILPPLKYTPSMTLAAVLLA